MLNNLLVKSLSLLIYFLLVNVNISTAKEKEVFETPKKHDVDYHVAKWFDDTHVQLVPVVERFMKKQNTTPVGYMAWRLENDNL